MPDPKFPDQNTAHDTRAPQGPRPIDIRQQVLSSLTNKQSPQPKSEQAAQTTAEQIEKDRQIERAIESVVNKSAFRIHTSVSPRIFKGALDRGFFDLTHRFEQRNYYGYTSQVALSALSHTIGLNNDDVSRAERLLLENDIKEVLCIHTIPTEKVPVFEDVVIPAVPQGKGILGFFKEPGREAYLSRRKIGERTVGIPTKQFVTNGGDEPVRHFSYYIPTPKEGWQVMDGRMGNMLQFEVYLPLSVATELSDVMEGGYKFIVMRRLYEAVLKRHFLIDPSVWGLSHDDWRGRVRPPYERWGKQSKGCVFTEKAGPVVNDNVGKLNQKCIVLTANE